MGSITKQFKKHGKRHNARPLRKPRKRATTSPVGFRRCRALSAALQRSHNNLQRISSCLRKNLSSAKDARRSLPTFSSANYQNGEYLRSILTSLNGATGSTAQKQRRNTTSRNPLPNCHRATLLFFRL